MDDKLVLKGEMDDVNASSSCDLGRREYWEDFYSKELENYEEYGDEGDIWFGKKNIDRIVNWILENRIDKSLPVLDVGCGNGMTLISLAKKGFKDLTGIDYAKEAITLAESIAKTHDANIHYQVLDFLENKTICLSKQEYHIIIDKGTFDAISLCQNESKNKRCKYIDRIKELLTLDGFFILFSCNWTKKELLDQFAGFIVHDEISIPSIGFGGKTGQTVTAIILKKR